MALNCVRACVRAEFGWEVGFVILDWGAEINSGKMFVMLCCDVDSLQL